MQKLGSILQNNIGENFQIPPLRERLETVIQPFPLEQQTKQILLQRIQSVIQDELELMAEEFKQIYYPNTITINQHGQQL